MLLSRIDAKQAVNWSIVFSVLLCAAIVGMGGVLSQFEVIPVPEDPLVYEWQLAEQTAWGQLTAWLGFALHQLLIWGTIAYAQKRYSKRDYGNTLRPVNLWALGINVVFIVLHYLQSMFFYDGIAQDLPSWTAQFAVALMLIVILGMENQRRGLFFGKKVKFRKAFTDGLRKYHGYLLQLRRHLYLLVSSDDTDLGAFGRLHSCCAGDGARIVDVLARSLEQALDVLAGDPGFAARRSSRAESIQQYLADVLFRLCGDVPGHADAWFGA